MEMAKKKKEKKQTNTQKKVSPESSDCAVILY